MDEIGGDDAFSSVLIADGNGLIFTVENEMALSQIMVDGEVLALASSIEEKTEPVKSINVVLECNRERECRKEEVNDEANDGGMNNEKVNEEENVNGEEMNELVNKEPNVGEVLTNQEINNEENANEETNKGLSNEEKTNEELTAKEKNDKENVGGDLMKEIFYHMECGNEAGMNEQDFDVEKANEVMKDQDTNKGMEIKQNRKEAVEDDNEVRVCSKKKVSKQIKMGKLGKRKKKIALKVANKLIHDIGKKGVHSKKKADKPVRKGKLDKKKKIVSGSVNELIGIDEENKKPPEEAYLVTQVEEMKEDLKGELSGKEVKEEGNMQEEMINGGNAKGQITKEEVKNEKRANENLKKKSNKQRKNRQLRGKKNIASTGMNEEELPSRRATTVAKTLGGMIFMCSSKTKKDCYHYKILGLPAGKREIVLKISKGMKLFLYDFDLKLLYGIYEAAGPGGYNIESEAFKSRFPSQVRFKVYKDCSPLPEEKFSKVIAENYYQKKKFDCQLTQEQVKNLCKLFQAGRNGSKLTQMQRSSQVEKHTVKSRDTSRKRRRQADTETSKFVDRKRSRKRSRKQEMRRALGRDLPLIETRDEYGTEAYQSRAALMPLRAPFPHAYEGTLERNVYRGDPLSEHQDMRYANLEWRHRDHMTSTRNSSNGHPDGRYLDLESRHREEIGHRDPYLQYWNHASYYDSSYPAAHASEYPSRSQPSHDPAAPRPEYWSHRRVYRY